MNNIIFLNKALVANFKAYGFDFNGPSSAKDLLDNLAQDDKLIVERQSSQVHAAIKLFTQLNLTTGSELNTERWYDALGETLGVEPSEIKRSVLGLYLVAVDSNTIIAYQGDGAAKSSLKSFTKRFVTALGTVLSTQEILKTTVWAKAQNILTYQA